ncbi:MAG TPA: NADH-ubiquinone oxidoreductase-F iron-sulfur binding region domain-containing protein [Mycobacteriales bacterium]|jgi:NADH:ubiquinone oxidoreductase subunit F (NADH-binding)|nr:NADH-ubiquinone oxidoreductase-F iron-sulfur binding region domain-containing protein [Mycobacteriales bacterium]
MTVAIEEPRTTSGSSGRLLSGLTTDSSVGLARHHEVWGPLPGLRATALIDEIESAGLLGRGGAGFPVARKLSAVAAGKGPAVVVANGCEGEPASAKDTMLLARVPHLVLDGIQLAARAVGADRAYLAVHSGSSAIPYLRAALAERGREAVGVTLGPLPRRYVASEESAIVSWLNGGDALPAYTPPRPFERGVNRRPTLISNVESLAQLATIARYGAEWYRGIGDRWEPGTMLVTVSGHRVDGRSVERRVAEVATGTTIGRIFTAAGLSLRGSDAVLVGGYFGSWLPAAQAARLPLTHAALRGAGAALGAGVLVALPPGSCGIAETARVASYLAANSARQCGPCLNGLPAIAGAMNALAAGAWDDRTWPALSRWLDVVPGRGACRHPDGAVRLVASALSTFAADVERHRDGQPCDGITAVPFLPVPR